MAKNSFLIVLILPLLLAAPLAASTPPTAVENCDRAYFGIGRAPDLPRALKCYRAEERWDLLIVMYLNGEGTPADVGKAESLLKEWEREDQIPGGSLEARALRAAIEERKRNPGASHPRIDYCRDIARDTLTSNFCGMVDDEIEEGRLDARLAQVRRGLTPAQRGLFDRMRKAFARFEEAEAGRVYESIGGTARILAAIGQGPFIRARFLALVEEVIEQRALQPADRSAYDAADRELSLLCQSGLHQFVEEMAGGSPEDTDRQIALYRNAAREAELRWLRYRSLFADLARSLYPGRQTRFDPTLSLKTALTRVRIEELRRDPLRPDKAQ